MKGAPELLESHEYEVASDRILRLVAESCCSACDREFVALAQELGTSLVMVEKQILKDSPAIAVSLASFVGAKPGR